MTRRQKTPKSPNPAVDANLRRHIRSLHLESVEEYRSWLGRHGFSEALNKSWQERRLELGRMEALESEAAAAADQMRHIRALGLGSPEEYAAWRQRHGWSASTHSTPLQRRQEIETAERERAEDALAASRRGRRSAVESLQALARGEETPAATPFLRLAQSAFASARSGEREPLLRLLIRAQDRTRLTSPEPAITEWGPQWGNTFTEALLALARHHKRWIRQPEEWQPGTHTARRQFASLARWMLANYTVPTFMDSAWFLGDTPAARQQQDWFIHIGIGENIRHARIPTSLTSRAAHYFLKAPSDFSIEQAFRWGQVLGLGGDKRLARSVAGSRLREFLEDEPFWFTVLQFLVNQEMLDSASVGPMVDYIYERKFVPVRHGDAPLDPAFSMKGRTFTALWRLVEAWHRELAREAKTVPVEWAANEIRGLEYHEEDPETGAVFRWTVQELLTARELFEEGRAMRHCVASYARSCAGGRTSIWSMRFEDTRSGSVHRVMTIELQNSTRAIVQARGRFNRQPGQRRSSARLNRAPEILKKWASQEQLRTQRRI